MKTIVDKYEEDTEIPPPPRKLSFFMSPLKVQVPVIDSCICPIAEPPNYR